MLTDGTPCSLHTPTGNTISLFRALHIHSTSDVSSLQLPWIEPEPYKGRASEAAVLTDMLGERSLVAPPAPQQTLKP